MPDLIRHPEPLEKTGFRLPFQGRGTVAGMTTLNERAIYKQTLFRSFAAIPPHSDPPEKERMLATGSILFTPGQFQNVVHIGFLAFNQSAHRGIDSETGRDSNLPFGPPLLTRPSRAYDVKHIPHFKTR